MKKEVRFRKKINKKSSIDFLSLKFGNPETRPNLSSKDKDKNRKAVSPVVSTMILIMIVIILAIIIVLFARSFIKEIILKEIAGTSKRVGDFCLEVKLKPISNEVDGSFGINNEGNVPIYGVVLKTSKAGNSDTTEIDFPLNPGYSEMIEVPNPGGGIYKRSDFEEVKIIPRLLGKKKSGLVEPYTCPDSYGVEI